MNEKEMIEEMARKIARILFKDCLLNIGGSCADCEWNGKDTKEYDCQSLLVAKKLLEKYQPKIPEGSVVLDRQEHQNYCAYKIIEPQIKGCLDRERELEKQVAELEEQRDRQAYITEELIQEKHKWTEQARKETAKEIAEELLNFINLCDNMELDTYEKISNKIDEIAKKFGVEVEE